MLNNALITGGSGMVGSNINFGLKPASSEMDITDLHSIEKYTDIHPKISCIIHLAAINLRESENNPSKSIDVNINGTTNMMKIAMKYNIPFVLLSTGAVFSSMNPDDNFDETRKTCPNCVYGSTKSSSEQIAQLYDKTILIRTGWLFGGNQKTHYKFVETTINHLLSNTTVLASNDFMGSPTYVIDLIEKIKDIIIDLKYGIHHIVNRDVASGYDIAVEVAKNMNKDISLISSVSSGNVPNSGPIRSCTEVLISNNTEMQLRSWKDSINEYIKLYLEKSKVFNTLQKNRIEQNIITKSQNRSCCRLCNSKNLYVFFKLEPTPPANQFILEPNTQEYIPLDVCICTDCSHIQLIQIVDPSYLYSNYAYVSSTSKTMTDHLQNTVSKFVEKFEISLDDNILEIGANDGICIQHLIDLGYINTIGVDPAENIHTRHNLPIICDFFGSNLTEMLQSKYGRFKLIFAFHCCAHIENIQDIFETIYNILDETGVFVMEVGYFYEVFNQNCFDTIYHEHIDYHTCTAINTFASRKNMKLFHVETNNIQGGSIQFYFCKNTNVSVKMDESVSNTIHVENEYQLFNMNKLMQWQNQIIKNGRDIKYILNSFIYYGKRIAGYGASAKSTTFLHQYKLNNRIIDFIIDDNVYKHNHFSPGLHIPIKPISILETKSIDYIIILSWNFSNEIIKKLDKFIANGGRIIIPFPTIQII